MSCLHEEKREMQLKHECIRDFSKNQPLDVWVRDRSLLLPPRKRELVPACNEGEKVSSPEEKELTLI
jgi:hypothetical protein